ncbi:uncharacterized protein LOC126796986 [Argentina anserina]|uniref:uncharacterized protein LOC126796986 n=1 Tax=Argentina anserina TaxID=57926 RepID=UPI0021769373|nr:uncharacterized protein LOC126796986 [Potentilla anserina]
MASSLVIPEKPTHRPGGCAGIFFQLLDWKRRFAKRKLFTQKVLLPSSPAKQLPANDNKMPISSKLHLIADENSGKNLKKTIKFPCEFDQKRELRAPGLVARLMGLEYMPSAHEKQCVSDGTKLLETGEEMSESRPQKLQRISRLYDKTAMTRFGAESVLPRSRKHHKLASPVKSSHISSGKSKTASRTSRLIGKTATIILDSGLHSTNRAKCALPSSSRYPRAPAISEKKSNSLMGQTCCKDYGNLRHVPEQQHVLPSFASNITNYSSLVTEQSSPSISSSGQAKDLSFQRTREQPLSVSGQKCTETFGQPVRGSKSLSPEGQASCQLSCKPHRYQMQHPMSLGKERIPPRYKWHNLDSRRGSSPANADRGNKNFVSLNRSVSNHPLVCTRRKYSKANIGKDECSYQLRTLTQKRRMTHVSGQITNRGIVTPTTTLQRNAQFAAPAGTGLGNGTCTDLMSQTFGNCELADKQDGNRASGNTGTDVISFTFSSPIKSKAGISAEMEGTAIDHDRKIYFRKPLSLSGDTVGVFLEQRELTCLEYDDLAIGASSKGSTAMIHNGRISRQSPEIFTAKWNANKSAGASLDGNHLSPGSVLEASFSSSSLDDSSGRPIPLDYPDDHLHAQGYAANLISCATSGAKKKTSRELIISLLNSVSRILYSINVGGERVRRKLIQAYEIILNAELLFGDATMNDMDGMEGLFMSPFLVEIIARSRDPSVNVFGGLEDILTGSQLCELYFDRVVEHIDSKYVWYCNGGFRFWNELPFSMSRKMMIQEVEEEIKKWTRLSGMLPDEIADWEMSHSLRKWTEFNVEAFEAGSEIDGDILQSLVSEVAVDLWECSLDSF